MSAFFTIMFRMRGLIQLRPWLTVLAIVALTGIAIAAIVRGESEDIEAITLAFAAISGMTGMTSCPALDTQLMRRR